MIEDMYAVMTRIDELRSRFGLKRHNTPEKVKENTGESYREISDRVTAAYRDDPAVISGNNPGRVELEKLAESYARKYDISPSLVKAVIDVESGYNTRAVSPKGARGLMQIMPSVLNELGVNDPFNPDENIRAGVELLREHLENYNWDYRRALAAYNAGAAAVDRAGGEVPDYPETQNYVKKVIQAYLDNE